MSILRKIWRGAAAARERIVEFFPLLLQIIASFMWVGADGGRRCNLNDHKVLYSEGINCLLRWSCSQLQDLERCLKECQMFLCGSDCLRDLPRVA